MDLEKVNNGWPTWYFFYKKLTGLVDEGTAVDVTCVDSSKAFVNMSQ